MTAKEFISAVAKRAKVSREKTSRVFNEVIDYGIEILLEGDEIRLPGFGRFELRRTRHRKQIDSFKKAKGKIEFNEIPSKRRIHFTAYDSAKDRINT